VHSYFDAVCHCGVGQLLVGLGVLNNGLTSAPTVIVIPSLMLRWGAEVLECRSRAKPPLKTSTRVPENGKAEIVDGEVRLMSPTGALPNRTAFEIAVSLRAYARRTGTGRAYTDNAGFVVDLPNRKSFSPDAAYHLGADTRGKFLQGAPIFAVEVRSEDD
jgi:hypothetical protein